MTPELAKAALQFLNRTQMAGAEVPAYLQVVQALTEIANPLPTPSQPEATLYATPAKDA